MSIKIREPEQQYEIALSKDGWLVLLAFLTECLDTVSSEALGVAAEGLIKSAREFVLSKEKAPEFKIQLPRETVLDLYLFIGEFPEQTKGKTVLEALHGGLKSFLLGGSE